MLASKLRSSVSTSEVILEIILICEHPTTTWLHAIEGSFLLVHTLDVLGQITRVGKHSSAVVLFANKL